MARQKILHSIYGNKFGLDVGGYPISADTEVQSATSATTATALNVGGITLLSSAETTWSLPAPVPGAFKTIKRNSASTATTGTISAGSSAVVGSTINYANIAINGGGAINLVGMSTSQWGVLGTYGNVTFS
jgi:hypothetical protein